MSAGATEVIETVGLRAPLMLVAARLRRRPGRWVLPALGIAVAAAFAAGVAGEGVITADRSARAVLRGLSAVDSTVRVSWQGAPTPAVERTARGMLDRLGLGDQTTVVLLNPVRLSGVVVRPAAIEPIGRWLAGTAVSRLGTCAWRDCPVIDASGRALPRMLAAAGVRLRVLGSAPLVSGVPLSFSPAQQSDPPVVVSGDAPGLERLAGLGGVYRTHSWLAPLPVDRLHSWQLPALETALERSSAGLQAGGSQFSLSAPFDGLQAASAQAYVAPRRLLLVGTGALAILALFVLLAAAGLRRDQLAELERLRHAGARCRQCVAFVVLECAWLCAGALIAGAAAGVAAVGVLCASAGEPVGGVLSHSLLTPMAAAVLAGGWCLATALMSASVFLSSPRMLDAIAAGAGCALVVALTINADSDTLAALLAPLVCLAAAVVVFRLAGPALRLGERFARRGNVRTTLALTGLARAPALPSAAIAFIAASVGLGGFALADRATLLRGAADQAADQVPLDAVVGPAADFTTPLDLAPLARWQALARGTVFEVRRTDANYLSGDSTATVPALGIPAGALAQIHGWRTSDGSAPLGVLARRLRPPGPVRVAGPALPVGARWLVLPAHVSNTSVSVTADLRDPAGAVHQVPLGVAGTRTGALRARLPSGRWELEALELDEAPGVAATSGHQNAENPAPPAVSPAIVTLGPLRALPRGDQVGLGAWRGVGSAGSARPAARTGAVAIAFAPSGEPGIVRPAQPSDARPVPVLVDPQTDAAAGPRGLLPLTVDGLPVRAHVVGVLQRFPTLASDAGGGVIADEATLASALDGALPGQGRADELWISTRDPGALRMASRRWPLTQLTTTFRTDVSRELRSAPLARGVLGTLLAAAVVAAALAVLGLLAALMGAARDREQERDLEAQGVGAADARSELRTRATVAGTAGVCAGLVIAVLLVRLAVAAVRAGASVADPQPALVTVIPWFELAVWGAAMALVLVTAGALAAQRRR